MQLSSKSILADTSGAELPAPVSMSIGDEIIWSENTGRTSSGCAVGTVIAEKQTVNITWGILDEAEITQIETKIPKGFIKLYIFCKLYEVYRGTLTKEVMGFIGDGRRYYRSATTDIVER